MPFAEFFPYSNEYPPDIADKYPDTKFRYSFKHYCTPREMTRGYATMISGITVIMCLSNPDLSVDGKQQLFSNNSIIVIAFGRCGHTTSC